MRVYFDRKLRLWAGSIAHVFSACGGHFNHFLRDCAGQFQLKKKFDTHRKVQRLLAWINNELLPRMNDEDLLGASGGLRMEFTLNLELLLTSSWDELQWRDYVCAIVKEIDQWSIPLLADKLAGHLVIEEGRLSSGQLREKGFHLMYLDPVEVRRNILRVKEAGEASGSWRGRYQVKLFVFSRLFPLSLFLFFLAFLSHPLCPHHSPT